VKREARRVERDVEAVRKEERSRSESESESSRSCM
jgi:hypothetical protein